LPTGSTEPDPWTCARIAERTRRARFDDNGPGPRSTSTGQVLASAWDAEIAATGAAALVTVVGDAVVVEVSRLFVRQAKIPNTATRKNA
jgi:hypothetical protein